MSGARAFGYCITYSEVGEGGGSEQAHRWRNVSSGTLQVGLISRTPFHVLLRWWPINTY